MALERDGTRRAVRLASVLLAGLFLLVLVANVLWVLPSPASIDQRRMPPTVSPFPLFRMGPILHVVSLDPAANLSTRLLMTSLQGVVNREQVELYLDVPKVAGNTSRTLSFLSSRYNVSSAPMTMLDAIDVYANRSNGFVVFDSTRSESIDITTMIASQQNGILVGSDLVAWLHARTRLPVLFDYASSDWASLDAIAAFDRALRELYPSSATTLLAILPPDRWAIRDYLVATRTFVFYFPQGALATPFEAAATRRILHATPRGIPILGWFNSPTLTEENSFVQLASGEGKFVVGVQDVPNLSVLTAVGRNVTHRQASSGAAPLPLEDKTYVVLAVSDGDNIDFAAGRMRELWSEPIRGTIPFAWSLNPLLVELAPPLLDAYYDSATPLDQFIAAPSGAGYLYPDYATTQDLSAFITFSKRYLNASDMDVVWLLNAFTASEIPYTSGSLARYVDGLHPGRPRSGRPGRPFHPFLDDPGERPGETRGRDGAVGFRSAVPLAHDLHVPIRSPRRPKPGRHSGGPTRWSSPDRAPRPVLRSHASGFPSDRKGPLAGGRGESSRVVPSYDDLGIGSDPTP